MIGPRAICLGSHNTVVHIISNVLYPWNMHLALSQLAVYLLQVNFVAQSFHLGESK